MGEFEPYMPVAAKVSSSAMRYHVFLSFRGKDVRKTLVDHLYQALSAAGLNVFLDSHKFKKGEIIDLSLENAINCSAICIPIFSKGYASSAWCLREASLMLASSGLIIPLFYEMEPTHVRYPEGESSPYGKSFEKHYSHPDRHSREEIDGWKHALEQICSRSGWSLDMTGRFEAQLVKKVVNDVIKTLDRVPLQVAKHPVGLKTLKEALIQKLRLDSAETVIRVGIWGIGGIGKTTLAKAVYNEVYGGFDAASFLFNVRDSSLSKLQGQILKDLVNYDEELQSVEKGKYLLTDRLQGIRAFVVLDDVDDRVQLDALAGDWLTPASRLIITSRDRHILKAAHISEGDVLQMRGLEENEGLQLFCWHAFLRPFPLSPFGKLSRRIVKACMGHPLSLEVIGAFLYDKQDDSDIDCWGETLNDIRPHRNNFETLYISYGGLSAEEKEIFLDIACFFIGESTSSPIVFWKSMYRKVRIAITNLSMKLLIKIDEKGVFDMHDLVRDMGRAIAEDQLTRHWDAAQSSCSFNKLSTSIIGLRLYKVDSVCLKKICTSSLRYLHLEYVHIEDDIDSLSPCLRWLKVNSCSFASSNLFRILRMERKSTSIIPQLRILDITDCKSIQNFPESITHLSHLQSLNLSGCQKLDNIPNTISNLSQLLNLNLSYCEKLRYLPDSVGSLTKLEYLNLTCCKILMELPYSMGNLSELKSLSLSWCEKLASLPESISKLSKLERLDMLRCHSAWKSIPYAILIKQKLRLLGLPPRVEEWRRGEVKKGSITENEDQTEEWTTRPESMTEFRATLAPECQKLEWKLIKTRLFPAKGFFRNRTRFPDKATPDPEMFEFRWNLSTKKLSRTRFSPEKLSKPSDIIKSTIPKSSMSAPDFSIVRNPSSSTIRLPNTS